MGRFSEWISNGAADQALVREKNRILHLQWLDEQQNQRRLLGGPDPQNTGGNRRDPVIWNAMPGQQQQPFQAGQIPGQPPPQGLLGMAQTPSLLNSGGYTDQQRQTYDRAFPADALKRMGEAMNPGPRKITAYAPGAQPTYEDTGQPAGPQVPFAPKEPTAPIGRVKNLPNRMAIQQEWGPAGWSNVGTPYSLDAPREQKEAPGLGKVYQDTYGGAPPPNHVPEVVNGKLTGRTVPMPGSEADPAVVERKRVTELRTARPKVESALNQTVAEFDKTLGVIDDIMSPDNDTGLGDVTGFGGTWLGRAITPPGLQSAKVQAKINQLKGRAFLGGIAQMKAASPTGATGLGATSEKEGQAVTDAQAALDQAQNLTDYKAALTQYRKAIADAKANIKSTFDKEYAVGGGGWSAVEVK